MIFIDKLIADLVGHLAWPILILIIAFIFRKEIGGLFGRIEELSFNKIKLAGEQNRKELVSPVRIQKSKSMIGNSGLNRFVARQGKIEAFEDIMKNSFMASRENDHVNAARYLKMANTIIPNQWKVFHNLGVELIYLGKINNKKEYLIEAEIVCKNALCLTEEFPYGTLYNLARAQAASGNIQGLKETFYFMSEISLPINLCSAIDDGDQDFEGYKKVIQMEEYNKLKEYCRNRITV